MGSKFMKRVVGVLVSAMIFTSIPVNSMTVLAEEEIFMEEDLQEPIILDIQEEIAEYAEEVETDILMTESEAGEDILTAESEAEADVSADSGLLIESIEEVKEAFELKADENLSEEDENTLTIIYKDYPEDAYDVGQTAYLSVVAESTAGDITYQWYECVPDTYEIISKIEGENKSYLQFPITTGGIYCGYLCEISNGVDTDIATFEFLVASSIYYETTTRSRFAPEYNETITMGVQAETQTSNPITYSWLYLPIGSDEYLPVEGADTDTLTVKAGKVSGYRCYMTDGYSTEYQEFDVEVDSGLEIDYEKSVYASIGDEITLKVDASTKHGDQLTYQWFKEAEAIEGADGPVYSFVLSEDTLTYYNCDVSDGINTEEVTVRVYVNTGLTASAEESVVRVASGETATLRVNASTNEAFGPVKYSWYCESKDIDYGEGDSSFTVENVTRIETFICRVSDQYNSRTITIYAGPADKLEGSALTFDTAVDIKAGETKQAILPGLYDGAGPCMYFRIVPDQTGYYRIYVSDWGDAQPVVSVYNADREYVQEDIFTGDTDITLYLNAGSTYYIRAYYVEYRDNYDVSVEYIGSCAECSWDTGVVTKPVTCLENGIRTYTCGVCKSVKTESIPAVGRHDWKTILDKAAGCGTAGSQHEECSVCHEKQKIVSIPATGNHSYGSYTVTTAPTVSKTGWETAKCQNCTETTGREVAKLEGTVTLTADTLKLQQGKSVSLTSLVTGLSAGDSIQSWESDKRKIADVTKKGKVTGKKAGTATITVTLASGKTAEITVKVQNKKVTTTNVTVAENKIELQVGKSQTLKPIITPISSLEKPTYKTSDKKIAIVNSKGKVTAKNPGKATITIRSGKKTCKVTVTVPAPELKSIKLSAAKKTLKKNQTFNLKVVLYPKTAKTKITYTSSDEKVAKVNSKGKVTAKKKGKATITVQAGKFTKTCKITVK